MSQLQEQLEGLPGYDIFMGLFDEYAEEHFNNVDPFEDEQGNRRRLPAGATKQEQKLWREVQLKAWRHDKCFLGSCGVGMDCGVGMAVLMTFFLPAIGPIAMYVVHARLIRVVQLKIHVPARVVGKLESQILLDLLITFPPLIGCFFGWLHACSTRNASLIYKYMLFVIEQRHKNNVPEYVGPRSQQPQAVPQYRLAHTEEFQKAVEPKRTILGKKKPPTVSVGEQQSGFV